MRLLPCVQQMVHIKQSTLLPKEDQQQVIKMLQSTMKGLH